MNIKMIQRQNMATATATATAIIDMILLGQVGE
jgi:hypothetical protein